MLYKKTINFCSHYFKMPINELHASSYCNRRSVLFFIKETFQFNIKELEIELTSQDRYSFEYAGNNNRMLFANINNIKCDFVHEPSNLLDPFMIEDKISFFSVKDITVMKLHTICGRAGRKIFFTLKL